MKKKTSDGHDLRYHNIMLQTHEESECKTRKEVYKDKFRKVYANHLKRRKRRHEDLLFAE